MQEIVPKIKELVEGLSVTDANEVTKSMSFYYGVKDYQNLIADRNNFPAVYLDEPLELELDRQVNNGALGSWKLSMFFCVQGDLDYSSEDNTVLHNLMRTAVSDFLKAVLSTKDTGVNRKYFRSADALKVVNVNNVFDACLTGVVLECTVTPLMPVALC